MIFLLIVALQRLQAAWLLIVIVRLNLLLKNSTYFLYLSLYIKKLIWVIYFLCTLQCMFFFIRDVNVCTMLLHLLFSKFLWSTLIRKLQRNCLKNHKHRKIVVLLVASFALLFLFIFLFFILRLVFFLILH